jgi:hypothetical protein
MTDKRSREASRRGTIHVHLNQAAAACLQEGVAASYVFFGG